MPRPVPIHSVSVHQCSSVVKKLRHSRSEAHSNQGEKHMGGRMTISVSSGLTIMLLSLVVLTGPAEARHRKKHHPAEPSTAFDYYVLSLSWSPEHCAEPAGHSDTQQCASTRHFAFVLHGLWPQYASGYPESCSPTPLSSTVRNSML